MRDYRRASAIGPTQLDNGRPLRRKSQERFDDHNLRHREVRASMGSNDGIESQEEVLKDSKIVTQENNDQIGKHKEREDRRSSADFQTAELKASDLRDLRDARLLKSGKSAHLKQSGIS